MLFSVEISIEKNGRRKAKIFQNKLCEKVARYVVQRQLTSYLYPHIASGPSDRSDQGKLRAQWKHHKYLKSPSVDAGDFPTQTDWLSNSDEQIHVKNAVVKAEAKTVAY